MSTKYIQLKLICNSLPLLYTKRKLAFQVENFLIIIRIAIMLVQTRNIIQNLTDYHEKSK